MSTLPRKLLLLACGASLVLATGCADSNDFAMIAAVAAGTAGEYAQQKGNSSAATDMFRLRDKIVNDAETQRNAELAGAAEAERKEQLRNAERMRAESLAAEEAARRDADVFIPGTPPPAGRKGMPDPYVAAGGSGKSGSARTGSSASAGASMPEFVSKGLYGEWRNEKAIWYFNEDGTARIVIPTLNNQGVATTYIRWSVNDASGMISYTITRATLEGSNGFDYDHAVDKSYTQSIRLEGGELIINTERLHR